MSPPGSSYGSFIAAPVVVGVSGALAAQVTQTRMQAWSKRWTT
jgi:hypothetical protein